MKLLGFWHRDQSHEKYNDRQYWCWILPYSCLIIKKCSQLKISRRDDGLSSVDLKSETETLRPDSPDDLSEYQCVPTKSRSSPPFRTSCSNLLGRPTIQPFFAVKDNMLGVISRRWFFYHGDNWSSQEPRRMRRQTILNGFFEENKNAYLRKKNRESFINTAIMKTSYLEPDNSLVWVFFCSSNISFLSEVPNLCIQLTFMI